MHPAWTYMLRDLAGSLWGVLVFALPMLAPGYLVAHWTNVCGFRERALREQLAWSLTLSFGIGTIAFVAITWITGVVAAGWLLCVLWAASIILVRTRPPTFDLSSRETFVYGILALASVAFVLLSLTDLGLHHRLWMSVTSYDHSVRTAFVGAVMRGGVPPSNPLYWPGQAAPMRYYYFWYVPCGVVARLAHITARQALIASCVWPLAGVAAAIALFQRYLLGWRGTSLTRRWWVAIALLSVTGLDLLSALGTQLSGGALEGDLEWWSVDQITSWADTFLWVPHHAAALIACLLCALLLWLCTTEPHRRARAKMSLLAGLCFASAFGLSTYVAAGMVFLLAPWFLWQLLQRDRARIATSVAIASGAAILVLLPYLAQLLHHDAGSTTTTSVLGFGVRRIIDPNVLNNTPILRTLRAHHPTLEINLAALLLLLPGYITELGFYGLVLLLASRRSPEKSSGERTLVFWSWSGLAAVTFLRSQVLTSNDYAFRATLLAQFFLLLLAVVTLERATGWQRRTLFVLASIGTLGSIYQVVVLRTYLPWHERHNDPAIAQLAERNYVLRDAFAALDKAVPPDARIQYGPVSSDYLGFAQMLQANRQIVNSDEGCATTFGGSPTPCPALQQAVAALYTDPSTTASAALHWCQQLDAQYLVAASWDTAWNQSSSKTGWVWSLPVVVDRPDLRVLDCRVKP